MRRYQDTHEIGRVLNGAEFVRFIPNRLRQECKKAYKDARISARMTRIKNNFLKAIEKIETK